MLPPSSLHQPSPPLLACCLSLSEPSPRWRWLQLSLPTLTTPPLALLVLSDLGRCRPTAAEEQQRHPVPHAKPPSDPGQDFTLLVGNVPRSFDDLDVKGIFGHVHASSGL